jgi:predicted metalloprotease with PDZ domain
MVFLLWLTLLLLTTVTARAVPQGAAAETAPATSTASATGVVAYTVSLHDPGRHLLHVTILFPPGAATRQLQLPVWNALYQVKDFAQYITGEVTALDSKEHPLPIRKTDKTTWQVADASAGFKLHYDFYANEPGPFGAQLDREHAFLNLAWFLMYPVGGRNLLHTVRFTNLPRGWHIATAMPGSADDFSATSYDQMVDSPVEISPFREFSFVENGARYRLAIDADPADYDAAAVQSIVRRIVSAAVDWMQDRPFQEFLFIYHFRRGPPAGGMEHSYSTAIDLSARAVRANPDSIASVTAHEFFHLWNVKRIRPASLEPVDYTRENYTPSLWFCEGATNTAGEYILLRAGLIDDDDYLAHLGDAITTLENRPAHLFQSVEESSLDTWLDKYSFYNRPERSISYYNKGEIVSVLLDLAVREASGGHKSLRDVFQWMNENYARRGRFYPDSEGIRRAVEAVTGADFQQFFRSLVAGTEPLPYDRLFRTVGLELKQRSYTTSDLGLGVSQGAGGFPLVASVESGSPAEEAGVLPGDSVLQLNGNTTVDSWDRLTANLGPGNSVTLHLSGPTGVRDVSFSVAGRKERSFELVSADNLTPAQLARRAAWLSGDSSHAAQR